MNAELTLYIVFAAVLSSYLLRIGNGPRLRIGTPFHNRSNSTFKESLGLFMEVYPLQVETDKDETFSTLITKLTREIQQVLINAQPGITSTASSKACDVLLNFVTIGFKDFCGVPVNVDWLHSGYAERNRALQIQLHDFARDGEFVLFFDLNCGVFPDPMHSPVVRHFLQMLDAAIADREQSIDRVGLIDRVEERRLADFSQGPTQVHSEYNVLEQITRRTSATPSAIALSCEGDELTYSELSARSNQLANFLSGFGVQARNPVGLCTTRSLESVIAILAVMKAGATYVPLDPNYPAERIGRMLVEIDRGTSAALLLTQRALAYRFGNRSSPVVCLDDEWERIAAFPDVAPDVMIDPETPVYVLFTPGSTGRPKGVMVPHRGLAHYIDWASRFYLDQKATNFPLFSSLSFDLTVTSLFLPLVTGGRCVICPESDNRDGLAILNVVGDDQVDVIKITPPHLALLAERDLRNSRIKVIILGGEDLKSTQAKAAFDLFDGKTALYNEYGPTEATVGCMIHRYDPEVGVGTSAPIGRPIDGTAIYVVDRFHQLTPVGVTGELCIASPALALGYLHQRDITAQQFIEDPFVEGKRMYATGDLARWRDDGVLEFLGRKDDQIKLRGARVELREVEAALLAFDGIRDAAVALHEKNSDGVGAGATRKGTNTLLVAYYMGDGEIRPADVCEFLGKRLPDFMLPGSYVRLERIPLTPNGKVDRQALPIPATSDLASSRDFRAPSNPKETLLAEIWAAVLSLDSVSVDDNFFELGGDSILNIQICSRARKHRLRLEPNQIFRYPSVAELAEVAVIEDQTVAEQAAVTGLVSLTPIQRRFFDYDHPQAAHWNQAVMLEVPTDLDRRCLEQAIQYLPLHHDALRMRYRLQGCVWNQDVGALEAINTTLEIVDISTVQAEQRPARIAEIESARQRSLDIEHGDLLRAVLFDHGESHSAQLLLIVHHLAVDGVSWYVLLQYLEQVYDQLLRAEQLALPPKTTSFKSWAVKLEGYAASTATQEQIGWWRNLAVGNNARISGDFGKQRSEREVRMTLDTERTQALIKDLPAVYNTRTDEVLITALMGVYPFAPDEDVVLLDLEGHGREYVDAEVDLSRTVGWFTSIYPVCLRQMAGVALGDALKAVKEQLRAVPHNGIGYGALRYLGTDAEFAQELESQPQPRLLFNYLGRLDGLLDVGSKFRLSRELVLSQDPECERPYEWVIDAFVMSDSLHMNWRYSQQTHGETDIQDLADKFLASINMLIDHCLSPTAGGRTPADYPNTDLTQQSLDELIEEFGE